MHRVKFKDADNVISPQFVCGTVAVHYKTWWHALIDSNSPLNSTVQFFHHFPHMHGSFVLLMYILSYYSTWMHAFIT